MQNEKNHQAIDRLLYIMQELRQKCPWDRKQTLDTLRCLTIEEVFELSDAIVEKNMPEIKKELGDILLHIVFYSQIAKENNAFDFADVCNSLCEKLIYRHPHVFGDAHASTSEEVKETWEKIKLQEKDRKKSVLSGVPKALPAMIKAYRIQDKAHGVHLDYPNIGECWEKVKEEMLEFEAEKDKKDKLKMEEEFGDLLFALIKYANFLGIQAEDALEKTNRKFIERFTKMEEFVLKDGKSLPDLSVSEMSKYWNLTKDHE